MAGVFKARANPQFNRTGDPKRVAGFKRQTELCVSYSTFLLGRKKHCKLTYLNWKENKKEHTEQTLQNLSSDDVYALFVLFRRLHENFGLN